MGDLRDLIIGFLDHALNVLDAVLGGLILLLLQREWIDRPPRAKPTLVARPLTFGELGTLGTFGVTPLGAIGLFKDGVLQEIIEPGTATSAR